MSGTETTIHATALRIGAAALLLQGPSGSGKSALALQLIGLGAGLIADDRVILRSDGSDLIASCPPTIAGLIEARGVGIINTPAADPAPVTHVVDMAQHEVDRLPPDRSVTLCGHSLPLFWAIDAPHFPATLLQILRHGRSTR